MNTTYNDLPTLRELLKSSVLLDSISKDFNIPIFILSYGYAQEKQLWQEGNVPNNYFRLTLINPC